MPLLCLLCASLQGSVSDKVRVEFYTNATGYEEWPSGGLVGNGTGGSPQQQPAQQ
jgi:hypothetical protein